ncbi:MAG: hypothetical protein CSB16_03380, partial [Clostridiales bacterium]
GASTANADFQNSNLGSFLKGTSLILKGGQIKTFKKSQGDVMGGSMYYRVYKEGATASNFIEINLPFGANLSGGNQKWEKIDLNTNLLMGLSVGNYVIEVYFKARTSEGDKRHGNNKTNYKATFRVIGLPASLKLTTPTPLKEDNLNNAVVNVVLENETFKDNTLDKANFILQNEPNGTTIKSVTYVDDKNTKVTLSFDGTDFDADVTNFGLTVKKEELKQSDTDLTKENLTITAIVEDELKIGNVTISPSKPIRTEQVTITLDATGTALEDAMKVYLHSGIGMDKPNSKQFNKTVGNWGKDDGVGEMTSLDDAFALNFLFRSADATKKEDNGGKNYHAEIEAGNYFIVTEPTSSPRLVEKGVSFPIKANANKLVNWTLDELNSDGTVKTAGVNTQSNIEDYTFNHSLNDENVVHYFKLTADFGNGVTKTKTFEVKTHKAITVAPLPNGAKKGVNYNDD